MSEEPQELQQHHTTDEERALVRKITELLSMEHGEPVRQAAHVLTIVLSYCVTTMVLEGVDMEQLFGIVLTNLASASKKNLERYADAQADAAGGAN